MIERAISFIFVLGVLIFVHELGHFLIAKKVGIFVERFSIGFPPYIFSWRRRETIYSVGIIPLGGFVKMKGENPDEERRGEPDEFMSKSVGQRAAVIFAGPFMNYVLAILIMIGLSYFVGRPMYDKDRIVVDVEAGHPAAEAGLKDGDQIIAVDGSRVHDFIGMAEKINSVVQKPVDITFLRGSDTLTRAVTTEPKEVQTVEGKTDTIGLIGVRQQVLGYEHYGVLEAVTKGFTAAHIMVAKTVEFVGLLISGKVSMNMIGGPLFIAVQSGEEASRGFPQLLLFMALLSVNLAVLNVLPIPVLDGGHLTFLAIEAIKGSPLSAKARGYAQQVGLLVLLSLIIFVTYNDIMRFFGG